MRSDYYVKMGIQDSVDFNCLKNKLDTVGLIWKYRIPDNFLVMYGKSEGVDVKTGVEIDISFDSSLEKIIVFEIDNFIEHVIEKQKEVKIKRNTMILDILGKRYKIFLGPMDMLIRKGFNSYDYFHYIDDEDFISEIKNRKYVNNLAEAYDKFKELNIKNILPSLEFLKNKEVFVVQSNNTMNMINRHNNIRGVIGENFTNNIRNIVYLPGRGKTISYYDQRKL